MYCDKGLLLHYVSTEFKSNWSTVVHTIYIVIQDHQQAVWFGLLGRSRD